MVIPEAFGGTGCVWISTTSSISGKRREVTTEEKCLDGVILEA